MATRKGTGAAGERQLAAIVPELVEAEASTPVAPRSRTGWLKGLRGTGGSALLEFAFALPFLAVIAVGILDFGQAYNVKHILTNAAREGARITVSNPLTDSSSSCQSASTPCSIQAAADAVKLYLTNAGLSTASCITPDSPSSSGTLKWTYSCSGITLTIDRSLVVAGGPSGTVIPSAQVTLSYPYTWSFGRVIGLLVKGATASLPSTLTTSVVMQILATG